MRALGLHLFCSVKGGVGKSTLAVIAAKLLAAQGRRPVVVDADVLGSSLADGLDLCAPVITEREGAADYTAAPTAEWYTLERTRSLRSDRQAWWDRDGALVSGPSPLVYINDALFYPDAAGTQDCRVDAMLWRHDSDDHVRYLPSSPLRDDARLAAPYASALDPEFAWVRRLTWIIDALLEHDVGLTDVIIDLPPGTWGLAHETLVLAGSVSEGLPEGYPRWHERFRWRVVPSIVTTPDRNDRVLAVEYWLLARERVPQLRVLLNRAFESEAQMRARIQADLPDLLRPLGIESHVAFVPALPSLGRIFVNGDIEIDDDLRELTSALRLTPEDGDD